MDYTFRNVGFDSTNLNQSELMQELLELFVENVTAKFLKTMKILKTI